MIPTSFPELPKSSKTLGNCQMAMFDDLMFSKQIRINPINLLRSLLGDFFCLRYNAATRPLTEPQHAL